MDPGIEMRTSVDIGIEITRTLVDLGIEITKTLVDPKSK